MSNLINVKERIKLLPDEIQSIIFYFIPRSGTAKVIKYVIDIYEKDHNYWLTKQYKLYYVKNILSFFAYIIDSNYNYEEYEYGPNYYNKGKITINYYDDNNENYENENE